MTNDLSNYAEDGTIKNGSRVESVSMKPFSPRKPIQNNLLSNLIGGALVAAGLVLAGIAVVHRYHSLNQSPEDFKNASWVQVDNSNGTIWDDYVASGIPQSGPNWIGYLQAVRDRNGCLPKDIQNRCLEGKIYIPKFN